MLPSARFPYAEGVALEQPHYGEHADGQISVDTTSPFLFADTLSELWQRFETAPPALGPAALSPLVVEHSDSEERTVLALLAALERDGAVVLSLPGESPPECCSSQLLEPTRHPLRCDAVHGLVSHSCVTAVCEGVIGKQILPQSLPRSATTEAEGSSSSSGISSLSVPPSIFTDDRAIRTFPWELEAVAAVTSPARFGAAYEEEQFGRQGGGILGFNGLLSESMHQHLEVIWDLSSRRGKEENRKIGGAGGATVTIAGRQIVPQGPRRAREEEEGGTAPTATRALEWAVGAASSTGLRALIVLSDRCTVTMTASHDDPSSIVPTGGGSESELLLLRTSYHAAYLRQRQDLFLLFPPSDVLAQSPSSSSSSSFSSSSVSLSPSSDATAREGLPRHIARLIGYFRPGPVLNKNYLGLCNSSDILEAHATFGNRRLDWARDEQQTGTASGAAVAPGTEAAIEAAPPAKAATEAAPPAKAATGRRGLETVDAGAPRAFERLAAALIRDGAAVIGGACSEAQCAAVVRDLQPYELEVQGQGVGCVLARSDASWGE